MATFTASVHDPSKAAIAGAQVFLIDHETHVNVTLATNRSGLAVFPALRPATYTLEVRQNGFKTFNTPITLATSDNRTLQVVLYPGTTVSVQVTADNSGALLSGGSVQTTIDYEQVKDLPLNGRTFQNLIAIRLAFPAAAVQVCSASTASATTRTT